MHSWRCRDRVLEIGSRPLVMGIVNVTPDSFSDGGRLTSADLAVAHAQELVRDGADILDIGGESTRPGANPVSLDEEMARVLPVVRALADKTQVPLSVDTSKAAVARACLEAGRHIINDITALTGDAAMADVAQSFQAGVVLMHMQGAPATMQLAPHYQNVVAEIAQLFAERIHFARQRGIAEQNLALDPGIGFGKSRDHNLEILGRLSEFQKLGLPLCLGVSRKGFMGRLLDRPVEQRLPASLAVLCHALAHNAVQIIRVHDVRETRDAVVMFDTLREWEGKW